MQEGRSLVRERLFVALPAGGNRSAKLQFCTGCCYAKHGFVIPVKTHRRKPKQKITAKTLRRKENNVDFCEYQ